nr:aminoacyl-tRNA synthetase, class 1a, anticodon-binding [Tanacetum cinerariifolium]
MLESTVYHARICSIIRKSSKGIKELMVVELILKKEEERVFGLHLLPFTEVLKEVCTVLMPHILCDYLYDLCTNLNSLHSSVRQANRSCDEEMAELLLCEAAAISLDDGLVPLMADEDVLTLLKYLPRFKEIEV